MPRIPPVAPNFDLEREYRLVYERLSPLHPKRTEAQVVAFMNVSMVYAVEDGEVEELYNTASLNFWARAL